MARKGQAKVIYKGTFVCKQTLPSEVMPGLLVIQIQNQAMWKGT